MKRVYKTKYKAPSLEQAQLRTSLSFYSTYGFQKLLAEKAGVSTKTLQNFRFGKEIALSTFNKISEAFKSLTSE